MCGGLIQSNEGLNKIKKTASQRKKKFSSRLLTPGPHYRFWTCQPLLLREPTLYDIYIFYWFCFFGEPSLVQGTMLARVHVGSFWA